MNHFPEARLTGRRKSLMAVAAVLLLLALGGLAWRRTTAPGAPTAEVRQGEFVDYIQVRGAIRALHSLQLTAPSIAGDLEIVQLAPTGSMVKKGDIVVQFETETLQNALQQKRSEMQSTQADIDHSRAEARLAVEQQATSLLSAGYNVERARLDASKQEILSEIDGAKNKLLLTDAEQQLKEARQKDISTQGSTAAEIEGKKQKREKSLFDVRIAGRQVVSLTLRAPADGIVTILPNFRVRNSYTADTPEFKKGDRAWAGAIIAELPDLSSVRLRARVDEIDRGRLQTAQAALVRIDAIAGKEFQGSVAEISPLAKVDYSSWPFTKNFDIALQISESEAQIRPGLSATGRIAVERIPQGILVPPQAIFDKDGHSVAYVLQGLKFEERVVQVARRGQNEVLIAHGLRPGERVALEDPTGRERRPSQ